MSAKEIFDDRKFYKDNVYPTSGPDSDHGVSVIDYWYEKLFYGRVNQSLTFIQLKETQEIRKQLPGSTEFAIDFVDDAFTEFRDYY